MRVSANVVAAVLLFSVPQGVDAIEEDMVYRNISGAILTDDDSQTGVDVSTLMTKDTAACIAGKGMNFVIPRAFRSSGTIDDNACSTLSHAKTAGISLSGRLHVSLPNMLCIGEVSTQHYD